MAKRKTLRRQRDKALKELETLKKRIYRIEPQPLRIEQFESRVRIFQAHCDVLELDLEHHFITEDEMVKRMLHKLVDTGYFDNCISKHAEYDTCYQKIRNTILIRVLQPEEPCVSEMYRKIWQK